MAWPPIDEFQLAINILLTIFALIVTIIFSFSWRKRNELIYWFIALIFFTVGHFILIFAQFDVLYEYIGNGIHLIALILIIITTFIDYIKLMVVTPREVSIKKREKIILALTISFSIIVGILTIVLMSYYSILDLLTTISVIMVVLFIPLTVFNMRIYLKQKTITQLFLFIIFLIGTITAFAVIFSVHFVWGRAMNMAMDFIFITLIMTGGLAAPIEQRITSSEETYRILNEHLEEMVSERTQLLEAVNHELEAFSYSVSHDLRTPLRSLEGFAKILQTDLADTIDENSKMHLERIIKNSARMDELINDLLSLGKISKFEYQTELVNLSELAVEIKNNLVELNQENNIDFEIQKNVYAVCDPHLIRIVLENLLGNAVKFSIKKPNPKIIFGVKKEDDREVYFVQDNGIGFDMQYYQKLFGLFQRLHGIDEYPGTGIGLIIVKRIIDRHKGEVWAEGEIDKGAIFYFTLE
ncbi:MAG: hypothetical protein JXA54_09830 [Candidatus Heimdallarchaeota archaeon]|nr:hypothetical protein [Candidatus Heimdallarchaeota archaeon]